LEKEKGIPRIGKGESNTGVIEDGEKNAYEIRRKKMYRGYCRKGSR
jgi:hypothetical protein